MARKNKARSARVVAGASGDTASVPAMAASWVLLLAALVTPLLTDSPGWFGLSRPFFRSGLYIFQAYAAQALVMGSLACFAVTMWRGKSAVRWDPALGLVLGLLGWTVVTTVLSPSPASAMLGFVDNSQGLLSRIVTTAALLLTVELVNRTDRIRTAARVIGLVGSVAAIVGLLQVAGVNPLGAQAVWGSGRSFGTLGNPDMFGGFIMFALFASLGVALSEKSAPWRVAMGTAAAACAASAVTSYSRAAWIGLIVGALAFAFLVWRSRARFDRRLLTAVVLVVLVVGAAAALRPAAPGAATDVSSRLTSMVSTSDPNTSARLEMWATALRAIVRRPIQGYGPDTMVLASEPVRSARWTKIVGPDQIIDSAHNVPIQTMSDLGVPGFLLWVAMLAAVAIVSFRTITRGSESAGPVQVVLAGLWAACAAHLADSLFTPSSVAGTLCLFCVLGLLLAPSAKRRSLGGARSRCAMAASLVALAVVGACVAVVFLAADLQASVSRSASVPLARRIEAGAEAVRLNPLSADYADIYSSALAHKVQALGETGTDPAGTRATFAAALAEAQRALTIQPTDQRRRSFLARILVAASRSIDRSLSGRALEEAAAATRMSPNDLQTRYFYATALDPARARPVFESIIRERPDYALAAIGLSTLDVKAGDKDAARNVLRAALAASKDPIGRTNLERALAALP